MGRVCAEHLPAPDLVILSPSVRTGETVRLFLEAWSRAVSEADSADVRVLDDLYLAGMRDWIRIIDQLAGYGGHVVGCGHQPGLGDFASWLDSGFTGTVSTAAVISFPITEGDGLAERGGWKVDYFGRPKDFSS